MRADQMFAYTRPDGVVGFGFVISPVPGITHHSIAWPDKACERYTNATLLNSMIVQAPVEAPVVSEPVVSEESSEVGELVEELAKQTADKTPETPPVKVAANPTVTKIESSDSPPASPPVTATPEAELESEPVVSTPSPSESIVSPGSEASEAETTKPTSEITGPKAETTGATDLAPTPIPAAGSADVDTSDPEPLGNIVESAKASNTEPAPAYTGPLLEAPYDQAVAAKVTTERTLLHLIRKTPTASDADIIRFLNGKGVQVSAEMVREQRDEAVRLEAQSGL